VTGIVVGLLAGLAATGFVAFLALGIRGRISGDDYHTWIRSPGFQAVTADLVRRRGARSAVTGHPGPVAVRPSHFARPHYLRAHHWTYINVGRELPWQLVLVTLPEHQRIHDLSVLWFGNKNRGLWLTTAVVVGWGKLTHRRRPTSGRGAGPERPGDLYLQPPPGPATRRGVRPGRSHRPPAASASPQAPMLMPPRPALPARPHPANGCLPCPRGWREHPVLLGLLTGVVAGTLIVAGCTAGDGPPTPPPSTLSRQAGPDTSSATVGPSTTAPTVALGPSTTRRPRVANGCPLGAGCPRPKLTPGAVIPTATGVCQTSYNPRRELTPDGKRQVLAGYGFSPSTRVFEWDHLVARWAGGTSTRSNVWPQVNLAEVTRKDRLEGRLYLAVCRDVDVAVPTETIRLACRGAELDLVCAQRMMRTFWRWW
jgi:hypothetical protein